ncbi:response regulator [Oribacterium sp. WCC10]|uniref:response regulator n=1 Tax=Oribacterium sp. WCC10 TaxID=1855343 RepID=UPI00111341DF|nr:response regulator [Oribacterium sp. WCC10]
MAQAMIRILMNNGYNITTCGLNHDEIAEKSDNAGVLILYLDSMPFSDTEIFEYIQTLSNNRIVCAVGKPNEYKEFYRIFPKNLVNIEMPHPANVMILIDQLRRERTINDESVNAEKKHKILLVDDDSTFLQVSSGWLKKYGKYEVAIVNSGPHAIDYLDRFTPELILLDYEMPLMDGPTVLAKLRKNERTKNIPVYFLTGKSDRESIMRVMMMRPNGYLLKTLDQQQLVSRVNDFFLSQQK